MKILSTTISLFLIFAACASAQEKTPSEAPATTTAPAASNRPAETAQVTRADYMVQPGDVLEIFVWKEKDLQKDVMVRPDGGINFPLAGDLMAAGKTLAELQKDLASKLAHYVPDPSVTVAIKQSLGNKIYVLGKVNKPGEYVANRNVDVMQALSIAGGLTPYASANSIKILRRGENGELKAIPFKYSRVEKGKDLEQNITLQGGDVVVVP